LPIFRHKPVAIVAHQFDGTRECAEQLLAWMGNGEANWAQINLAGLGVLQFPTSEADHTARRGDWIVMDAKGEFSPCKPDAFTANFEPI